MYVVYIFLVVRLAQQSANSYGNLSYRYYIWWQSCLFCKAYIPVCGNWK